MCRWFAYISPTEACLLEDVLVTPKHSLARQVHDHYLPKLIAHDPNNVTTAQEIAVRNRLFNTDGLGVAWYTSAASDFVSSEEGTRPTLYKNNHPFVFGRYTFMHNGQIADFVLIRRALSELLDDDVYAHVIGSTDSEHLGALIISHLTSGKGKSSWETEYPVAKLADAMRRAVKSVIEIQRKQLGERAQPNDLNLALTDGKRMVAYRFRNHATEQPPSLYWSTEAGKTLNRKYPDHPDGAKWETRKGQKKNSKEHGTHVIVSSEPTTYKEKDWNVIPKNHVLTVEENGKVEVNAVEYDQAWDAEDNGVNIYAGQ
ncbi:hypothetical protein LTR66_008316 [Elasticomyces elasticus]|nr:hypothetical protein LTR66_008316 [Elasticomyces elasticus]